VVGEDITVLHRPDERRYELLLAGEHPGLNPNVFYAGWQASKRHQAGAAPHGDPVLSRLPDGLTERAQRYQRELRDGRWVLPDGWPATPDRYSELS